MLPLLVEAGKDLPGDQRASLETLCAALDEMETGEGLPQGLVHPDFCSANVIVSPAGELVLVDWTGAGRGARIGPLGWLLCTTGGEAPLVDAVVAGYRRHVQLELEELERLPRAVPVFELVLGAWGLALLGRGTPGSILDELAAGQAQGEVIAARVREAYKR